jgi:hypothetical protein
MSRRRSARSTHPSVALANAQVQNLPLVLRRGVEFEAVRVPFHLVATPELERERAVGVVRISHLDLLSFDFTRASAGIGASARSFLVLLGAPGLFDGAPVRSAGAPEARNGRG